MNFDMISLWKQTSIPGKGVLISMALMAIYLIAISIERFIVLLQSKQRIKRFSAQFHTFLQVPNIEKFLQSMDDHKKNPLALLLQNGLTEFIRCIEQLKTLNSSSPLKNQGFDPIDLASRAMERGQEQSEAFFKRGLGSLATIASSAPFVGLLGTVIGIIHVFSNMKTSGASGGINAIAGGIGEALITTAFGLVIAIPASMLFNYFTQLVDKQILELREASALMESFLIKQSAHLIQVAPNSK